MNKLPIKKCKKVEKQRSFTFIEIISDVNKVGIVISMEVTQENKIIKNNFRYKIP